MKTSHHFRSARQPDRPGAGAGASLQAWQPDHYLLLGDLLNHGPRNPVPAGYDPAAVAARLNQLAPRIMAVRGNCDSEVDQMLLHFPITAPYNQLLVDGRRWFVSHGHLYDPECGAPAGGQPLSSAAIPTCPYCGEKQRQEAGTGAGEPRVLSAFRAARMGGQLWPV